MTPQPYQSTAVLGPEYDNTVRDALRDVLHELGVTHLETTWGVGGSQEVETGVVSLRGHTLIVEAETYVGLTISGDEDLVSTVAERVAERMGKDP